jgi:hypothetical protein
MSPDKAIILRSLGVRFETPSHQVVTSLFVVIESKSTGRGKSLNVAAGKNGKQCPRERVKRKD